MIVLWLSYNPQAPLNLSLHPRFSFRSLLPLPLSAITLHPAALGAKSELQTGQPCTYSKITAIVCDPYRLRTLKHRPGEVLSRNNFQYLQILLPLNDRALESTTLRSKHQQVIHDKYMKAYQEIPKSV